MKPSKSFCILPFVHLYSSTDGEVRPCCIADSFKDKPNLKDGIESAFNSVSMKKLRHDMMEGRRNLVCNVCYKNEDNNIPSSREMYNESIDREFTIPSINEDFSTTTDFQYIDIRFSNLCNFKCVMCTHEFSSQWYEDMGFEDPNLKDGNYQKWNTKIINISNNILDELKPHLSKIKKIYFAGGEPLIMKENYQMLKFVLNNSHNPSDKDNGIELYYNTNLSTLSYKGDEYLKYWKKFKKVYLSISCDGLGEVGEYQRVGFKSEKLLNNLNIIKETFIASSPNTSERFGYGFQYTVTPLNVFHIFDFIDFMFENEYITDYNQIRFFNAFGYYSLTNLSDIEKTKIESFLKSKIVNYKNTQFSHDVLNLIKTMNNGDVFEPLDKVKRFTEYLDKKNNQNYIDITKIKFE